MIKLDPDEEDDEDDDNRPFGKQPVMKNQSITSNDVSVNANGNSSTLLNDSTIVNNVHLNNVQINLTRVSLPPEYQNFVSDLISY